MQHAGYDSEHEPINAIATLYIVVIPVFGLFQDIARPATPPSLK